MNLNITVTNVMMSKYTYYSKNHWTGFGRRGEVFEVNYWSLDVPLSWWISWFVTMKVVGLVSLSSKTGWEEFRSMDDASNILVSNYSTIFLINFRQTRRYEITGERLSVSLLASWDFMIMGVDNLVVLRCHGGFYTGVIFHGHK